MAGESVTGLDRAACVLALHWLHAFISSSAGTFPASVRDVRARDSIDFALDCLNLGGSVCDVVADAIPRRRSDGSFRVPRLLRVRLTLLLRAILRADAGDFGPTVWVGCTCHCDGDRGGPQPMRITPLWMFAREHRS